MAPRHTMRRFSASLTQRKTKSGVFACFKGRGGKWEGRGTLTEMRSVGDGTLRMQQNEAVFIKKPSETPYYENLAEERCASEATLWTQRLRIFGSKRAQLCRVRQTALDAGPSPPRKRLNLTTCRT